MRGFILGWQHNLACPNSWRMYSLLHPLPTHLPLHSVICVRSPCSGKWPFSEFPSDLIPTHLHVAELSYVLSHLSFHFIILSFKKKLKKYIRILRKSALVFLITYLLSVLVAFSLNCSKGSCPSRRSASGPSLPPAPYPPHRLVRLLSLSLFAGDCVPHRPFQTSQTSAWGFSQLLEVKLPRTGLVLILSPLLPAASLLSTHFHPGLTFRFPIRPFSLRNSTVPLSYQACVSWVLFHLVPPLQSHDYYATGKNVTGIEIGLERHNWTIDHG